MDIEWLKSNVFPFVNFTIFSILFVKFAKKPLAQMFHDRASQFEKVKNEAMAAVKEAELKQQELDYRLNSLKTETANITADIIAAAENEAKNITEKATRLASTIVEDARVQAENEIRERTEAFKKRVMGEVVAAAQKEANQILASDASRHASIIEKQISSFSNIGAHS